MGPKARLSGKERGMRANKGSASTEGAKSFISFSDVASSSSGVSSYRAGTTQAESSVSNLSPLYLGDDVELSVITKKLSKKNAVSKLKALQEMKAVLEDRGSTVISALAPFFVFIYNRLVLENQTNIREESNAVLEMLMKVDRKSFAVHMKHLIAPWYYSTCDPGREIGSRAQAAFEIAFLPKKRREVLTFFSDVILRYLVENITNATPESLCDNTACSPQESEDRYERVVAGSYAALAKFLFFLYPPSVPEGSEVVKGGQALPIPDSTTKILTDVISVSFFKKTTSKRSYVRCGAYAVLSIVCSNCPHFLIPTNSGTSSSVEDPTPLQSKKLNQTPLNRLTMIIFNAFTNEKEPGNISSMFHSFMTFTKSYPGVWELIELESVVRRLVDLLHKKDSESFVVETTISFVLPIIAAIPLHAIIKNCKCIMSLVESLSRLAFVPLYMKAAISPGIALMEICTYLIIQVSREDEVAFVANPSLGSFLEYVINEFLSQAKTEWKKTRLRDGSNKSDSKISTLLCALHKANKHLSNSKPPIERRFWEVFTTDLISELNSFESEIDEAALSDCEGDVLKKAINFIDNMLEDVLGAFRSAEHHNIEEGIHIFLRLVVENVIGNMLKELKRSYFCWIYVIIVLCPSLHDQTDNGLNILANKHWIRYAFLTLNCSSTDPYVRSFVEKILGKSFALVKSLSNGSTLTQHRLTLLESCVEFESVFGLCLAIDSGLVTQDVAVSFMDEKHALHCVGAFLKDCLSVPTLLGKGSTDSKNKAALQSADISTRIQILVQCQDIGYLRDFTDIDVALVKCLSSAQDESKNISEFDIAFVSNCCAFLTRTYSRLTRNEELDEDIQNILSSMITLVYFYSEHFQELGGTWKVLTSWQQVQDSLIPICPTSVIDNFRERVIYYLNMSLSHDSFDNNLTFDKQPTTFRSHLSTIDSCRVRMVEISPEKWAELAHGFLLLCRQMPDILHFDDVLKQLYFHSINLWTSLLARLLKMVSNAAVECDGMQVLSFAIRCIFLLDTLWTSHSDSILSHLVPITSDVHVTVCIFQSLIAGQRVIQLSHKEGCATSPSTIREDISDFLECCQLLIRSFVKSCPENSMIYGQSLLLHTWNLMFDTDEIEFFQKYTICEAMNLTTSSITTAFIGDHDNCSTKLLSLETPLFTDVIPKSADVHYVLLEKIQNQNSTHTTCRPVLASLVSTHRDDGPEHPAFYTLLLCGDEERELQTEAARVILESKSISSADAIGLMDENECKGSVPLIIYQMICWMRDLSKSLMLLSSSSTSGFIDQNVSFLGFGLHFVLRLSVGSKSCLDKFIAHCRQSCLNLLENKVSEHPAAVCLGLEILNALASDQCEGVGNGFWIVSFLIDKLDSLVVELRGTSRLVFSSSSRFCIHIQLCHVLTSLLVSVSNRRLTSICIEFLKIALNWFDNYQIDNAIDKSENSVTICMLADAFVHCLATLWSRDKKGNGGVQESDSTLSTLPKEKPANEERSWSSVYHSDLDLCGLKHCFHYLFKYVQSINYGFGEHKMTVGVSVFGLVTAIDQCLQNQLRRGGRQATTVLLQASGISIENSNDMSSNCYGDSFILSIIGNPHIDLCIRILLTKVLDILYTSQPLVLSSIGHSQFEGGEGEVDELIADEMLTRNLLGDCLFDKFKGGIEALVKGSERKEGYMQCLSSTCSIPNDSSHSLCSRDYSSSCERYAMRSLIMSGEIDQFTTIYNTNVACSQARDVGNICSDTLGVILLQLLVLQKIDTVCTSASETWAHKRAAIGLYLTQGHLIGPVLKVLLGSQNALPVPSLTEELGGMFGRLNPSHFTSNENFDHDAALGKLFTYALYRSTCLLPVGTRTFWNENCNRSERIQLEKFIETRINRNIVMREIAIVRMAEQDGRIKGTNLSTPNNFEEDDGITVRCSAVAQEFITTFTADEVSIEMTIRLPALYPLRNVEVDCTKKMGISEGRWRRWILQIIQLLSHQDGSVLDAILLWKKNVDKEFEGVEPCPICYSILHPKTLSLPTLCCSTCKNKFHSACLYKWFHSSGKSKCVLCQQPFF